MCAADNQEYHMTQCCICQLIYRNMLLVGLGCGQKAMMDKVVKRGYSCMKNILGNGRIPILTAKA